MSFIGSIFSNSNGAGFQASGDSSQQLSDQYNAGQANLGAAAEGYNTLATQGSQLAQQQLAAANGQNIQQAAGLVASQKGINPALAARMAGQNAAQAGNQAANQSAQLQSQVQMAGLQGLASTGSQQAGIASQTLGNQNTVNASIAAGNQANQAKLFGGALNSAGSAAMMAKGGMVPHYDDGGQVNTPSSNSEPQSAAGKFFQGYNLSMQSNSPVKAAGSMDNSSIVLPGPSPKKPAPTGNPPATAADASLPPPQANALLQSAPNIASVFAKGGKVVPAMLSPGERYLPPQEAKKVAQGKESPMKAGKEVPGKAKVKGDSLENDIVPAKLEEGGIVIPRSVLQSKDAAKKAAAFVAAHLAKGKKKI